MSEEMAVKSAQAVMTAHIDALNRRDNPAIAATLHFPHLRLSGTTLKIWEDEASYLADFLARAGDGWHRSEFADMRTLRASHDKVHLDVEVRRYDGKDRLIACFRSLWVLTSEGGRWAAKMRSSFAAA